MILHHAPLILRNTFVLNEENSGSHIQWDAYIIFLVTQKAPTPHSRDMSYLFGVTVRTKRKSRHVHTNRWAHPKGRPTKS